MKEFFSDFVGFLAHYDFQTFMDMVRTLDWWKLAANPYLWGMVLVVMGLAIWKRQLELLILVVSIFLFLALAQHSIPPAGQTISLDKILEFMVGSAVLIGVNVYFLIIREK